MKFRRGDRVVGLGRAGAVWTTRPKGVVTGVRAGSVFVAWDGTIVEDQMDPADLERAS